MNDLNRGGRLPRGVGGPPLAASFLFSLAFVASLEAQERTGSAPNVAETRESEAWQEPVQLSLEEAVRRAVTLDQDVLVARAEEARIRGTEREVRARSLPDLSLDAGYTRNLQLPVIFFNTPEGVEQITIGERNDYQLALSLTQPLLDFSLGPARRAATLSRRSTAATVEAARTAAALEARLAYFAVLLDRELVRVQELALAQARARLADVEGMVRAGTASEFDLLTAQVEVENLRPELIEAENRLALDRNRLKRTVALPLRAELVLTDSLEPPDADDELAEDELLPDRALRQRADVEAQRLAVDLYRQNVAAERGAGLPSFDLVAGLTRRASSQEFLPGEEDFTQSATAGLSVNLPLFDGRARAGRVQQAEAAVDREGFRLRRLEEDVRLEVQQARQDLRAARERIAASRANVRRAERALEMARSRFRTGVSSQLELSEAELGATRARTNYAEALHAFHVARARLMAAVGQR